MGKLLFFSKDNNDYSEIVIIPSSDEPKTGEEAFKEFEEQLMVDHQKRTLLNYRNDQESVKKVDSNNNNKDK